MEPGMLPGKSGMVRDAWSTALDRKRAMQQSRYPMTSSNLPSFLNQLGMHWYLPENLSKTLVAKLNSVGVWW